MAVAESIFADIARVRWPAASPINGTGAFAVISRCPQRPFILLFEFASDAQAIVSGTCTHAFCKGDHALVNLNERQPARPPAVYRKKPHWARLIDDDRI